MQNIEKRKPSARNSKASAAIVQQEISTFKRRIHIPQPIETAEITEVLKTSEGTKATDTSTSGISAASQTLKARVDRGHSIAEVPHIDSKFSAKEWIETLIVVFVFAVSTALGGLGSVDYSRFITISGYRFSLDLFKWSAIVSIVVIPLFIAAIFALNPAGRKPIFHKNLHVISWIFFTICGIPAHMVLTTLLTQFVHVTAYLSHPLSMLIVLIYEYLIIKLYAYDALEAKFIGWELFRFALVGVVAAIADFLTTSTTRTALSATGLSTIKNGNIIITTIAVTAGFIVGVIVNYILSVYMVYKSSKNSSAGKWWGVLLFVGLSAVGLGIGIGLEMWLYNRLGLSYILVFIIRTAVVLIWNYVSRKLIIFR